MHHKDFNASVQCFMGHFLGFQTKKQNKCKRLHYSGRVASGTSETMKYNPGAYGHRLSISLQFPPPYQSLRYTTMIMSTTEC